VTRAEAVVCWPLYLKDLHVVTTLAQGMAGMPIRVVSVLAPGQSAAFSTPHQAGALEISRNGDSVFVHKAKSVSN
jgi:hypothetical protein